MKRVKEFFAAHWDQKSPLLIGYSGGPDSKALLYTVFDIIGSKLHVAHVDHSWREESLDQAEFLRKEVESLSIPFYMKRLDPFSEGNAEAYAREQRLVFFRSLFEKIPFQALLLGHHAGDLAETVLKRVLEGAHLSCLRGMEPLSYLDQMPVWRPLLRMEKREILAFLKEKSLEPLFDPTNNDPSYLRSRLRQDTLPLLQESFGKNIMDNLCVLSERSHELKLYLDQKIQSAKVIRKEGGCAICCLGFERIERRHLLQKIGREEQIFFTRPVLEQILDFALDPLDTRKIFFQSKWILAGRGWVFFLPSDGDRTFVKIDFCF